MDGASDSGWRARGDGAENNKAKDKELDHC